MSTTSLRPLVLVIMDGIALNPNLEANALHHADTPVIDALLRSRPSTTLTAWGNDVGLPGGQMGNSEVGHLNIGAGRVVKQELTRIDEVIENDELRENETLSHLFSSVKEKDATLHLIGLVSTGGVHSDIAHVRALLEEAVRANVRNISLHVITDGRDRPQNAAIKEVAPLSDFVDELASQGHNVRIATLIGRYYAMDRDKRWERTQEAYDLFVHGKGEPCGNVREGIQKSYDEDISDEFIRAHRIESSESWDLVSDEDSILFFNFRPDRMRQIVAAFLGDSVSFDGFQQKYAPKLDKICSLTSYSKDLPTEILFPPQRIENHLGEVLSEHGLSQVRIAETEKYPHVTYFLNGGIEKEYDKEERILIPSPRDVATYDLKPEMSANEVTSTLISKLQEGKTDVAIVNFANGDMVGHTGVFEAAVAAVETVDTCLGKLLEVIDSLGGAALITADHGNADQMIDYETREPHTFHTMHPVPFIVFSASLTSISLREDGSLCDIAPTILDLLEIEKPPEMTGSSLLIRE